MRDRAYTDSIEFITRFFGVGDGVVELRACPNVKGEPGAESLMTRQAPEVRNFCQRKDVQGIGTYFGVCRRIAGSDSGSAKNIFSCPALWVDIDCVKQGLSGDEVISALEYLPHPPTMIINSGGGLHAYWLLEEALDVSEGSALREPATTALRALAHILAGDMQCAELARIMRLPGTMNSKDATMALYDGNPAICGVISDTGTVHDFEALCEWLSEQRTVLHGQSQPAKPVREDDPFVAYAREAGYEPAIDIEAALAAMEHGSSGDNSIHGTQLRVSMSMIARGYDDDEIVSTILAATERAAPAGEKWNWAREEAALRKMIASGRTKALKRNDSPARAASTPQNNGSAALKLVHDAEPKPKADKLLKEAKSNTVAVGRATIGVWQDRHGPVMHSAGTTYCYEEGIWIEWDDRFAQQLRAIIQEACASLGIEPKTALLNAAKAYFMDRPELARRNVEFDRHGLLVADDACLDMKTMKIVPHSPTHFATIKMAATLEGSRECKILSQFMADAFSDKSDGAEVVSTLQEWFGAAIMSVHAKTREMMKGLILYGPSRSGKSQVSELVRYLLGHEHVNGSRMSDLSDRFGREPLIGKRGWIADDAIGEAETLDAETYKVVVTGERTSAMRKGAKNWNGYFGIPVLLTANNMPRIRDQTDATFNRSLIAHMTNVREEGAPEPVGYKSISEKIGREELTGLLWWAIEGWQRLVARGKFDPPTCMRQAIKSLQDDSNPVGAWFRECVTRNSLYRVARADLIASFQGWRLITHDNDREWKPYTVTRRIREITAGNEEPTVKGVRYIAGIALNEEGLVAWERWKDSRYGENIGTVSDKTEVNKVYQGAKSQDSEEPGKGTIF